MQILMAKAARDGGDTQLVLAAVGENDIFYLQRLPVCCQYSGFGHLKLTSLSARPEPVEVPFFLQEGRCFDKLSTSGENPLTRTADIARRKAGLARFAMLGEFDPRDRAFMDFVGSVGEAQRALIDRKSVV